MSVSEIDIVKAKSSKLPQVDWDNLVFGTTFTDHMLEVNYRDGKWQTPQIRPYGNIEVSPGIKVFHYGQAIFEGMKAFKDTDGNAFLFRPEQNAKRFNISAERLAMPAVPEDIFLEGIKALVDLDRDWIPTAAGASLYIRPFMIADEVGVSASGANEFKFMVLLSPVQTYYAGKLKVVFAEKFSRSMDGGTGYAKAAGNYAAQFYPTNLAKAEGFHQVVWTDSKNHEYLEEAGTMNVFFRVGDTLLTAPNNERILDGITRKSILQLAEDAGLNVEVRRVSVKEIVAAAQDESLKEIFGAGTAAVVSFIEGFSYQDKYYQLPEVTDSYGERFKKELNDIQWNRAEDRHGWRVQL